MMGNILSYSQFQNDVRNLPFKNLIIFIRGLPVTGEIISANIPMAKMLADIDEKRRAKSLEQCFLNVIRPLPKNVLVTDFDVMFNPSYHVDVLKILISAHKTRPFRIVWPGLYQSEKLIYADEDSPDYHVFHVKDYDITCLTKP